MAKVAGNLQRIRGDKRFYAITPRIPGGFIQADTLQKYVDVAKKFKAVLKCTSGQRIMITNLRGEDVEEAWAMLGMKPTFVHANTVRTIKICPGITFCKRAKQDSISLGMKLDKKYAGVEMPSRMKIGVSGCQNSCAESIIKDIGIIGMSDGWKIFAGGSAGAHPRFGLFIGSVHSSDEVLCLVDKMMDVYKNSGHIERMGDFIERIGLDEFKQRIGLSKSGEKKDGHAIKVAHNPVSEKAVLKAGDTITADSIIKEVIDVYPETIQVLLDIGMGCLGCPSATAEPLWQAAHIHGVEIEELLRRLESARRY